MLTDKGSRYVLQANAFLNKYIFRLLATISEINVFHNLGLLLGMIHLQEFSWSLPVVALTKFPCTGVGYIVSFL